MIAPRRLLMSLAVFLVLGTVAAALAQEREPAVRVGRDGTISYATDELGNRVIDFSHAGYRGGGVEIPLAPARVVVTPAAGDQTQRIQQAIDHVSSLRPQSDGLRGAVLLAPGTYEVAGALYIRASGVVLRGSGMTEAGTTLLATGRDRRTLITLAGTPQSHAEGPIAITDKHVPVNATRLTLSADHGLRAGDRIDIRRPSSAEWIKRLHMHDMGGDRHGFSWRTGSRDLVWDRTILRVDGPAIELDAPLTLAIDATVDGAATVRRVARPGEITECGIEGLRLVSTYERANPKDEAHSWTAIVLEHARDVWIRQVTTQHFAGSAVMAWESASRVTVEDCTYLAPAGETGGWRRNAYFTSGQQVLFRRCYAEDAMHAFAVGFAAAGPNAFVQCEADRAMDDAGPIDSAAAGVLFDNVRIDGNAISLIDRQHRAQGAGWSAFNCVLWNCSAAVIRCFQPPGAQNYAFGTWGEFSGNGYWQNSNDSIEPLSLYVAQLRARLGESAAERSGFMAYSVDASSSPTPEKAAELAAASTQPAMTIRRWIELAASRSPISTDRAGATHIDEIFREPPSPEPPVLRTVTLHNGWLTIDGKVLLGGRQETQWWRGSVRPSEQAMSKPAITRFVPGRTGLGATDDLDLLADVMVTNRHAAIEHHYGLWYDRRRDDHQRVRRMDGSVAAPFFEQPFARSGRGVAWDGLSLYDLTKFNPWYWDRLARFASLADRRGILLISHNYFQHNILEAGAHWADSPWRAANNINDTGFPEPPPYAGDKRIFMAEQFYDLSHEHRRALHRAYIRQCFDALSGASNVIQLTSDEYTGPLHFTQFWLDVAAEWSKEKALYPLVGLSATKDVQDAILADPGRIDSFNVIDIRYWWYQPDGQVYAPPGGQNLAPRQWARVLKPKPPSFEQVVRAVREYRMKHPGKAILFSVEGAGDIGWAALIGGASLAAVTVPLPDELLHEIPEMLPIEMPGDPAGQWALGEPGFKYLVYTTTDQPVRVKSEAIGPFVARWIDPKTGEIVATEEGLTPRGGVIPPGGITPRGGVIEVTPPAAHRVLWLSSN